MIDKNLVRAVNLYKGNHFLELFYRIRVWDAPYEETEKIIPVEGSIVDLGCGDGLFANYLAVKSGQRNIIGIDSNPRRISQADRRLKNTEFVKGDALKAKLPKADAIVMYHLLHHLNSYENQKKLIKKAMNSLKEGGKLVVVEIDKKPSFKFIVTWVVDRFIYPILFDKKLYESKIFYRSKKDWKEMISDLGFRTKITSAEKGKPFTHIVIVCNK